MFCRFRIVECVETGQRWDTLTELAKELGFSVGKVCEDIRMGLAIRGRHYVKREEYFLDDRGRKRETLTRKFL